MKQVRRRTLILFSLAAMLALGLSWFCLSYTINGRDWVSFFGYSSLYQKGSIYDRNGTLLYDGEKDAYGESKSVRKATMHLVGDRNIATSLRSVMGGRLSGYHPITGTSMGSHDLYLTIDASLNETAYSALNGKKGVVAVYNYQTGEILCLVSAPSFDPKNPPSNLEDSKYEGVYLNRFFSSTFPPGSIFKIVTTAAALEQKKDWSQFRYTCTGKLEIGGQVITCPKVHGSDLTLEQAFARSCNGAYASLALELGGGTLQSYAKKGALLDSHEISGISTAAGSFEVGAAGSGDLAWSGSGQFHDMVNPASFLMLMGGIANDGVAKTPTLLKRETFSSSKIPSALGDRLSKISIWEKDTCVTLKEMMRNNVLETYGQKGFGDLNICAKSGTAEVGNGGAPHAWFAGFLDDAKHPLAFIVLVENGGSGSSVAGSVAAKVLLQATS
jgi:peptidoglycan glycosyltransferase